MCLTAIRRRPNGASASLSLAQQRIWAHCQIPESAAFYHRHFVFRRARPTNLGALEQSFNEILRRHEILRTRFFTKDGQLLQVACPPEYRPLTVTFLPEVPEHMLLTAAAPVVEQQIREPFDFERGPLLRAHLLRMRDDDYQLHLTVHAMVADDISIKSVFSAELDILYSAFSAGREPNLPQLPVQFADVAAWQCHQLQDGSFREDLSYWREQLRGELPVLRLQSDHARNVAQGFRAGTQSFVVSDQAVQALKQLSTDEVTSFFGILLAGFAALLHRYTDQDDILLGTLVDGRKQPELRPLIGCFQNLVPLRIDLGGNPTFRELVRRVGRVSQEAFLHDSIPFEALARELEALRSGNSAPFDVMFSLLTPPPAGLEWSFDEPYEVEGTMAPFSLWLQMEERKEGALGRFCYDADRFEEKTIRRMVTHLEILLEAAAVDPERHLSELPLLSVAEQRQMLECWNATQSPYPRERCIHELIQEQCASTPHAIAARQGNETLTYADLNARANQLARFLCQVGVRPEVPVAICLEPGFDLLVALLGTLKAGGACLPLDPKYPAERLLHMLEDARPGIIVTSGSLLGLIGINQTTTLDLRKTWPVIAQEDPRDLRTDVTPENLAYVIYTSGSTGSPRGVLLGHRGLVNHHIAAQKLYALGPNDRVLQFSSISFDIAIEEIFPTWMSGATVVLRTRETPLALLPFLEWIQKEGITVLDLPTAYWHEMVYQLVRAKASLPQELRLVIVGGEKASSKALSAWSGLAAGRVRWINTYGPSEASVIATAYELNPTDQAIDVLPIGRPIDNTRIYLLDRYMNPVPIGVAGELHIGGVGVGRGYLNRPELTAEKFIRDPFSEEVSARLYRTGDLARYLPSGEIEFLGRRDEQVKIRGFRVETGEVEAALGQHANTCDCVVVARETADGQKQLIAYVVPAHEPAATSRELRRFLQTKLPEYMVPSTFVVLPALPMTPNGKVDKKALPPPYDAPAPLAGRTPQDTVENRLLRIWEEVLAHKPIAIDDNFFELGGHSLLAVRLMYRIEETFGKRLPITALFEVPTVEGLAQVLRRDGLSTTWSSLVPIQTAGSRPPFFCVHGIGGTVLRFRDLARLLQPDQPFYGLQAQGLDGVHPPYTRVEEMAAHYVREIRGLQSEGPFYLGGYSFGGTVALEMARLLRLERQEVRVLVLLDTIPGQLHSTGALVEKYMRLPADEKLLHLARKIKATKKSIRRRIAMLMLPRTLKKVKTACYIAARNYRACSYDGPVVLFQAKEKTLSNLNVQSKWRELTPKIEIYEVVGHHGNIVDEPQVQDLAAQLRRCLEAAQASSERSKTRFAFTSELDARTECRAV
ncbi:MAG: amino acid adenylation domain-containing protein [Acidobacteria bacterium]|nr:amino acid adenylation domain-containing protein [Acidobacteriota bacterium]